MATQQPPRPFSPHAQKLKSAAEVRAHFARVLVQTHQIPSPEAHDLVKPWKYGTGNEVSTFDAETYRGIFGPEVGMLLYQTQFRKAENGGAFMYREFPVFTNAIGLFFSIFYVATFADPGEWRPEPALLYVTAIFQGVGMIAHLWPLIITPKFLAEKSLDVTVWLCVMSFPALLASAFGYLKAVKGGPPGFLIWVNGVCVLVPVLCYFKWPAEKSKED